MIIHKLNGIDDGVSIFLPVLCGSSVMNRKKASTDNQQVTCKKCLKLIDMEYRGKKI